jgi:hypothetical protein
VTDPLAAIRAEKTFAKLAPADRDRVLAAMFEAQRKIQIERGYDRFIDRTLRLRLRNALKAHLTAALKTLDDPVCGWEAIEWLTDRHLGNVSAAMLELRAFERTARHLLDGAVAFEPDVGRKGRGEPQLDTELTRQAFYELIEVLESVGIRIGATGGKRGGPSSRLLALLITHAVGFVISFETVKDLVQERRRSK